MTDGWPRAGPGAGAVIFERPTWCRLIGPTRNGKNRPAVGPGTGAQRPPPNLARSVFLADVTHFAPRTARGWGGP